MNAFVINEDQIKKAGLALAVVVIGAFVSGYFLGAKLNTITDQKSSAGPTELVTQQTLKGSTNTLNNNDLANVLKTNQSQKKAANPEKAEKFAVKTKDDKKQAQIKKQKKADQKKADQKKADQKKADRKKADRKKADKKKAEQKKADRKKADKKKADKKKAEQKKAALKKDSKNNGLQTAAASNAGNKLKNTADASALRFYSIQAGMFSSEVNAKSFIKRLATKKYDAYISDFVSSSGSIKYNVRVGRFEQRDQARELLKDFQKSFSSPAYVVISR